MRVPGERIRRPRGPRGDRRRRLIIIAAAVIAGLIGLGAWATFYTDLLWFREVGFTDVFWTQLRTKALLGLAFGGAFALLLLLNLWVVTKVTSPQRLFSVGDEALARYRTAMQPYVRWIIVGLALLFGLFAGSGATAQWRNWLLFSNSVDFGQTDPVFAKDLGFYVFRLPFHRFLLTWGLSSLVIITLAVAAAHYVMGGIRPAARGERVAPEVRAHLSVLLGSIVLLKAWGYRLDQFDLLYSPRGTVTGASYTDIHAQLPALRLLVIMALVVGVLFLVNVRIRAWILPVGGIALLALTSIFAGGVYPTVVQRLRVNPVERIREQPFIERNIQATRDAFGIDDENVTVARYPARGSVSPQELRANRETVQNIRLWRPQPVLAAAYQQLQRIRPYYEFTDVDVDRYQVGNRRQQVMIAPREVSQRGLPDDSRTWVNRHLVYTHGFGYVASQVSSVTPEGQPVFLVKDIPPKAPPGLAVEQPRVYFGESEEVRFVVTNTGVKELDFPTEEGFEENVYEGKGGIPAKGFLRRAAFAWRFRDVNLLISGAIKGDSKILFRRRIEDRVRHVAPFLQFDGDPYAAVAGGRIVYIVDGFTTTSMFPYSQRLDLAEHTRGLRGDANYVRNSVKAVVDAYDGTVTLYGWDERDPVLRAWRKAFPGSITPRSEMSKDLLSHVRYPEDMFRLQTDRYTLYHMTDPDDFYSREDAWSIPGDPTQGGTEAPPMDPYYLMMRLPGSERQEFVLVRPFTPSNRPNMIGWMAARNDPEVYGELRAFQLPKESLVFGPQQVFSRMNNFPAFSEERTLFTRAGSNVIFGDLLVIPIGDSFIYVQPVYLVGEGSQLPELKRVLVVAGANVGLGATLGEALEAAVTGRQAAPAEEGAPEPAASVAQLIDEALDRYARAQEALRRGDLAAFQAHLNAMKRALDRADQASG